MADIPLFTLDAKSRWRLAYDDLQWVLQVRRRKPDARSSGFVGVSFVATTKRVLMQVIRQKGVGKLTPEAAVKLDLLPATFNEFRAALSVAQGAEGHGRKCRKPASGTQTPERPTPALHAA